MGAAAYNRGSVAISNSIYGQDLSPVAPVVPRAADWGAKAHQRAMSRARGLVRHFMARGSRLSPHEIADMIRDEQKCGARCAINAAAEADREYWGDHLNKSD